MFFYIAKVVWFCLQPSSLLLILLVAGAVLLFTRYHRTGRRLVVAAAVLLFVGGLLPLSTWLILPLEDRFPRADISGGVDGIVVLGGAEEPRIAMARKAHALNEAGERMTEAAALGRRFPHAKMVFTSGSVEILGAPSIGADAGAMVLEDLGITGHDRLLLERASRNTWQNAVYTKALVKPKPGERWLLVTSAAHMPRAMGAFRKAGFPVAPWPVDYRTAGAQDLWRPFPSPAEGLRRLDQASREWVGLLAYWLTGRSASLFPGPQAR